MTRREVARFLGVSYATVRRLQGTDLHPRRDYGGVYKFDFQEVQALRERRPGPPEPRECANDGDVAAESFKLFRDGVDQRDAVIALKRAPHEIEQLYIAWERMGGAIFISDKVCSQLQRLAMYGLMAPEVLAAIEADDHQALQQMVDREIPRRKRSF
jgi:hypothetical protein